MQTTKALGFRIIIIIICIVHRYIRVRFSDKISEFIGGHVALSKLFRNCNVLPKLKAYRFGAGQKSKAI